MSQTTSQSWWLFVYPTDPAPNSASFTSISSILIHSVEFCKGRGNFIFYVPLTSNTDLAVPHVTNKCILNE